MKEVWKDVPEWEGHYQVSDQGRVKSLDRSFEDWCGVERKLKGAMLSPRYSSSGRVSFIISKFRSSKKYLTGAQLVAMAFLGHKPTKADRNLIMHENGDYGDCRLSNLKILTPEEFLETYQVRNSFKRRMLKHTEKEEVWKDIPEYEGLYQASDRGRIKKINHSKKGRVKKTEGGGRYYITTLVKDGVSKSFGVHQLVAMTFLGHTPCGHKVIVDHRNKIKTDNRLCNLRLISGSENVKRVHSDRKIEVSWWESGEMIEGEMKCMGETYQLGLFKNEIEALKGCQKMLKRITKSIGDRGGFKS